MGDGGYSRIRHGMVQDMIEAHGESAYAMALERVVESEGDDFRQKIWKDVLKDLDKHFKGEADESIGME
jgi:hypothetical protein